MKKNNKGFSLVELIIVIAIMAILAGALAPALIKYINKSRRSTDIQNADSLRTAIQTALSNPDAADSVDAATTYDAASISASKASDSFMKEVYSVVGNNTLTTKYSQKGETMMFKVDMANNTVTVYAHDGSTELSPTADGAWK